MIAPPEYDVVPIAAPVLPHPVRPRRRDKHPNNPSVLNHPQNLQLRGIWLDQISSLSQIERGLYC